MFQWRINSEEEWTFVASHDCRGQFCISKVSKQFHQFTGWSKHFTWLKRELDFQCSSATLGSGWNHRGAWNQVLTFVEVERTVPDFVSFAYRWSAGWNMIKHVGRAVRELMKNQTEHGVKVSFLNPRSTDSFWPVIDLPWHRLLSSAEFDSMSLPSGPSTKHSTFSCVSTQQEVFFGFILLEFVRALALALRQRSPS